MAGSAESWGYGGDMYVPTNRVLEGVAGIGDSDKSLSHLRFFFSVFCFRYYTKAAVRRMPKCCGH